MATDNTSYHQIEKRQKKSIPGPAIISVCSIQLYLLSTLMYLLTILSISQKHDSDGLLEGRLEKDCVCEEINECLGCFAGKNK